MDCPACFPCEVALDCENAFLSMIFVLFVILGLGGLRPCDQLVYAWMDHEPSPPAIWASHLGDNLAYLIASVYAAYLYRRDRAQLALFLLLLVSQHLFVNLSKAFFQSLRPLQSGQVGGFAFPSGHTAMATCVYGSLARRGQPGWLLLIPLVAWSRMALGHHWFSDVLGGGLAGWICLSVCYRTLASKRSGDQPALY